MPFLLDTNVISESMKPHPDGRVVRWLAACDEETVFLSVATIAEIRFGVERLTHGKRRRRLDEWLRNEIPVRFGSRILVVDAKTADEWGRIARVREAMGRPIETIDAIVAATAGVNDLTLVTRNTKDFANVVTSVLDPWSA